MTGNNRLEELKAERLQSEIVEILIKQIDHKTCWLLAIYVI